MQLKPFDVVGPYEIVGLLGKGSFAETYKAKSSTGDLAAIKILRSDAPSDGGLDFRMKRGHSKHLTIALSQDLSVKVPFNHVPTS